MPERSTAITDQSECPRHGLSPHHETQCLTCALEEIAISVGGKAPGFYLDPDPSTTLSTLERSRGRYLQLQEEEAQDPCPVCGCEVRTPAGYLQCECPAPRETSSVPGSTPQQRRAVILFREHGSQSQAARVMGISRAGVHALLKRAGVIEGERRDERGERLSERYVKDDGRPEKMMIHDPLALPEETVLVLNYRTNDWEEGEVQDVRFTPEHQRKLRDGSGHFTVQAVWHYDVWISRPLTTGKYGRVRGGGYRITVGESSVRPRLSSHGLPVLAAEDGSTK